MSVVEEGHKWMVSRLRRRRANADYETFSESLAHKDQIAKRLRDRDAFDPEALGDPDHATELPLVEGGLVATAADADRLRDRDLRLSALLQKAEILRATLDQWLLRGVDAMARLHEYAPRVDGYETGGATTKRSASAPVVVAFLVGLVEFAQTETYLAKKLPLFMGKASPTVREVVAIAGAAVVSFVVMYGAYSAGKLFKKAVIASRAAKLDPTGTSGGGDYVTAGFVALLALVLQTVTLAYRMSASTGDPGAKTLYVMFGVISFIGATFAAVLEYHMYVPAPNTGTLVASRQSDEALVANMRKIQLDQVGIASQIRNLKVEIARETETQLHEGLSAAQRLGGELLASMVTRLANVREQIADLQAEDMSYEAVDLHKLAKEKYGIQPIRPPEGEAERATAYPPFHPDDVASDNGQAKIGRDG